MDNNNTNISKAGNPKATKGGMLVMSMPDFPATLRNVGKDENSYFSRMAATLMYEGHKFRSGYGKNLFLRLQLTGKFPMIKGIYVQDKS